MVNKELIGGNLDVINEIFRKWNKTDDISLTSHGVSCSH